MFRSRPDRDCWHFCENCPAWPWDCDEFETAEVPPRDRWCKTCVRMYEAGTGDLQFGLPIFSGERFAVFGALCGAWKHGELG